MGFLVDAAQEAVGSVKSFVRYNTTIGIPSNWVILDGSVLVDPASPFNGHTLPDTRGRVIQGHPTLTNANFGSDTTYFTGGGGSIPSGGTSTHNLAHVHAAGAHTHALSSHTHTITASTGHTHAVGSHSHGLGSHFHTISSDGSHDHTGATGVRIGADVTVTAGAVAVTSTTHTHSVSSDGSHDHGGATAAAVGVTDAGGSGSTGSGGAHDHGGSTGAGVGSSGPGSGSTDSALTTIDNKAPWLGFVQILRVK